MSTNAVGSAVSSQHKSFYSGVYLGGACVAALFFGCATEVEPVGESPSEQVGGETTTATVEGDGGESGEAETETDGGMNNMVPDGYGEPCNGTTVLCNTGLVCHVGNRAFCTMECSDDADCEVVGSTCNNRGRCRLAQGADGAAGNGGGTGGGS